MTARAPARTGHLLAAVPVTEYQAWSTRGIKMLVAGVGAVLAGVAVLWYSGRQAVDTATAPARWPAEFLPAEYELR